VVCNYHGKKNNEIKLMNLDHKYLENTLDWYYMCAKCHKIYDYLAGLVGNKKVKSIPNLIKNLKQLQNREEREQLLKEVILKSLIKEHNKEKE